MVDNTQYYITEKDVSQLMAMSGLPRGFQRLFARDYVAIKRDVRGNLETVDNLVIRMDELGAQVALIDERLATAEDGIIMLTSRMDTAEVNIADLQTMVGVIEVDLADLRIEFDGHVAATEAHGSNGNVVGTDNYCTEAVGGTVLLAGAVTDNAASAVVVTSTPNAAPAAYSQADAATWVAMLNELKADVNQLASDHNDLVLTVNQSNATERAAKQRAV